MVFLFRSVAKNNLVTCCFSFLMLLSSNSALIGATTVFDLTSSWSDTQNPHGVWSYNEGPNPLPHVQNWEEPYGVFSSRQPGWAKSELRGNHLPIWFKSVAAPVFPANWKIGDIVVHSTDTSNGRLNGPANVTWTSPRKGFVNLTGGVWMGRDIGRAGRWSLFVRNQLLTTGDISSGDIYNRERPFEFTKGTGGSNAVSRIPVNVGDVIRLEINRTTLEGDFVGVRFSVQLTSEDPKIYADSLVTTIAGIGTSGLADGAGMAAQFSFPNGAYVTPQRTVYIADGLNHSIRAIDLESGLVTTLAGNGQPGLVDGIRENARFNLPLGVFVDRTGNVYVADSENNCIRKITRGPELVVSTIAGSGERGYADGPSLNAWFNFPNDLAMDSKGNLYVTEFLNHTVRKITPDGMVSTFAGNGRAGFRDEQGTQAMFNQPSGIAIDLEDNLYVTEWNGHRVRRITPDGLVSTVAGSGEAGFVDGTGAFANLNQPDGIAVDPIGNLYVCDSGNRAIRRIGPEGTVTTVAGVDSGGFLDGEGRTARFSAAGGIGFDRLGSLIVADTGNNIIRQISLMGRPQWSLHPQSWIVVQGSAVAFQAAAVGVGTLHYQWFFNGKPLTDQTSPVLTLKNVQGTNSGDYKLVVSGQNGLPIATRPATLTVLPSPTFVNREVTNSYFPGQRITVTLRATPPAGTSNYGVEDLPPRGWTVLGVSEGGSYDAANHKVRFGIYFDDSPRVLSYDLLPPFVNTSDAVFLGAGSINGTNIQVGGAMTTDVGLKHPADLSPADGRLTVEEITSYGTAWKQSVIWPIEPNPVPIDYVTRAGALWKAGEKYSFDMSIGSGPLWWAGAGDEGELRISSANRSSAVRVATTVFLPLEPVKIEILITPAPDAAAYAVEEIVPERWSVIEVGQQGEMQEADRRIKWGPFFDNQTRKLTYVLQPSSNLEGKMKLQGVASFDGASNEIVGVTESRAATRIVSLTKTSGGLSQLQVQGFTEEVYRIEVSNDLRQWQVLTTATNVSGNLLFREDVSNASQSRFYRIIAD